MSNPTPEVSDATLPTLPRLPGSPTHETPPPVAPDPTLVIAPPASTPMTPPTVPGPAGAPSLPTLPGVGTTAPPTPTTPTPAPPAPTTPTPMPPTPATPLLGAPTLAVPGDRINDDGPSVDAMPSPLATNPLSPPAQPTPAAPLLPPVGGAPAHVEEVPEPPPVAAPSPPSPAAPQLNETAPKPSKRRSPMRILVPLALAAGFAVIGYIGFQSMTGEPALENDPGTVPAATTPPAPTFPLVAPINDARVVVEQINDNATEDELITELSGDPGEPGTSTP